LAEITKFSCYTLSARKLSKAVSQKLEVGTSLHKVLVECVDSQLCLHSDLQPWFGKHYDAVHLKYRKGNGSDGAACELHGPSLLYNEFWGEEPQACACVLG